MQMLLQYVKEQTAPSGSSRSVGVIVRFCYRIYNDAWLSSLVEERENFHSRHVLRCSRVGILLPCFSKRVETTRMLFIHPNVFSMYFGLLLFMLYLGCEEWTPRSTYWLCPDGPLSVRPRDEVLP